MERGAPAALRQTLGRGGRGATRHRAELPLDKPHDNGACGGFIHERRRSHNPRVNQSHGRIISFVGVDEFFAFAVDDTQDDARNQRVMKSQRVVVVVIRFDFLDNLTDVFHAEFDCLFGGTEQHVHCAKPRHHVDYYEEHQKARRVTERYSCRDFEAVEFVSDFFEDAHEIFSCAI